MCRLNWTIVVFSICHSLVLFCCSSCDHPSSLLHTSHLVTKPTKWLCTLQRLISPKLSSCGQRRLWSDWVDAGRTRHVVGFIMRRLIYHKKSEINWEPWKIALIILNNLVLTYTLMCPKDAYGMANSVDPDQTAPLIWIYTSCPNLSVWTFRIITVQHQQHYICKLEPKCWR